MGKKIVIPESVNTLTSLEFSVCRMKSKRIKWPVSLMLMTINVPQSDLEEAQSNKTVRELVTKYKFSLQSTIV